jgi:hypothetical protein
VATKKKPVRRATARKSAGRASKPTTTRKTAAATKTVAGKLAASAKPAAAKKAVAKKAVAGKRPTGRKAVATKKATVAKGAATRSPHVAVVSKIPAARRGAGGALDRIPHRAVFIDVENTSSEDDLFEVLETLRIDRAAQPTELTAVGNWRAIGQRLGRNLASIGAQLVHSAPATGVKDWSDLWIAVAAGCWLGAAQPGDVLEIVSNDRAFDAVGDAAAARGVIYRRLLHKRGAHAAATAVAEEDEPKRRRRSRGGRRRRGRSSAAVSDPPSATTTARSPAAHPAPAPAPPSARRGTPRPAQRAPSHPPAHAIEPHGAPRDQILSVIGRLSGGDPSRWINLDVLEKELKAEGFARPPGSPRLVTRLRMFKDIEVDSHGRARLSATAAPVEAGSADAEDAGEAAEAAAPPKKRRRRRKPTAGSETGDPSSADAAPLAAAPYLDPPVE